MTWHLLMKILTRFYHLLYTGKFDYGSLARWSFYVLFGSSNTGFELAGVYMWIDFYARVVARLFANRKLRATIHLRNSRCSLIPLTFGLIRGVSFECACANFVRCPIILLQYFINIYQARHTTNPLPSINSFWRNIVVGLA